MAIIEVNGGKGNKYVGTFTVPVRPEDVNKKFAEIAPLMAQKCNVSKGTIELVSVKVIVKKDSELILPDNDIIGA